jgi:hypothetical protein
MLTMKMESGSERGSRPSTMDDAGAGVGYQHHPSLHKQHSR